MENTTVYDATIIRGKRWFSTFIPVYLAVILITGILGYLTLNVFIWMGFFISCLILFFVYQKKIYISLSDKVELIFDDNGLIIKDYPKDSNTAIESTIIWQNIISYRFRFGNASVTALAIKLKTSENKRFSFTNEQYRNDSPDKVSVYSVFTAYIETYNESKPAKERIINNSQLVAVDPYPGIKFEVKD